MLNEERSVRGEGEQAEMTFGQFAEEGEFGGSLFNGLVKQGNFHQLQAFLDGRGGSFGGGRIGGCVGDWRRREVTGVDLSGVLHSEVIVGTDGVGSAAGIEAMFEGVEVVVLCASVRRTIPRRGCCAIR